MVWDAKNSSKNIESLAIAPWLWLLTYRVPDANVVLVGNKWDLVVSNHSGESEVESQSRAWLGSFVDGESVRISTPRAFIGSRGQSCELCAACPCYPGTSVRWGERLALRQA